MRFQIVPRIEGQHGGGNVEFAYLNEPQAALLIAFMRNSEIVVKFKVALVKGFYDMRAQLASKPAPQPVHPLPAPANLLYCFLEAAKILETPVHIAQIEAVKTVRIQTGTDFSNLLAHAPAQNDIKPDEEMLEPTELGKLFGINGKNMNLKLLELGLQERKDDSWIATDAGRSLCTKHA